MDDQDLTPWQEINPAATSGEPPKPLSTFGETLDPILALRPASEADFRRELTACLSLAAPTGMNAQDRKEWLIAAWGTLKHLPADMLAAGCRKARETCDHPSKIVPAILAETSDWLETRRNVARSAHEQRALPGPRQDRSAAVLLDQRGTCMTAIETATLNAALEHLGAKARYRPDGSRYMIEAM